MIKTHPLIYRVISLTAGIALFFPALSLGTGLVEDEKASNQALLVGVSHGLDGIDIDVDNLEKVSNDFGYKVSILEEDEGTSSNVKESLKALSTDAGKDGSLLYYFTGHGSYGTLYYEDKLTKITEMRDEIIAGRKGMDPIKRIVMIFDSCHSGSLIDPLRKKLGFNMELAPVQSTAAFVNDVVSAFSVRDAQKYWDKLFVFASSKASESSLASPIGSIFTLAFMKAYEEVIAAKGTVSNLVEKSIEYTKGHTPVAKMVPASMGEESL